MPRSQAPIRLSRAPIRRALLSRPALRCGIPLGWRCVLGERRQLQLGQLRTLFRLEVRRGANPGHRQPRAPLVAVSVNLCGEYRQGRHQPLGDCLAALGSSSGSIELQARMPP
jgi:hypothetical protein